MTSKITKRSLITIMGLAPIAVSAEAFATKGGYEGHETIPRLGFGLPDGWPERREKFAKALENLAAEVRADRAVPIKLQVITTLEHEEWEKHQLILDLETNEGKQATA